MFRWLGSLFAEQTTPDEVIVFLLICVLLAILFSFALYTLILAALWHGRLRGVTTLRALIFPDRGQLMEYFGEYALAGTTSLLLTLTVAARHDAVRQVLDYPLVEVEATDIRRAFPFGRLDAAELGDGAGELASALAAVTRDAPADAGGSAAPRLPPSIGVEALLLPTVAAGGADQASLWLRLVIANLGDDPWPFPKQSHLLVSAVVMLLLYVGWFAWGRSRSVAAAGRATGTEYGKIAGRFLLPAVCIALLLVSAVGAADPQRIARSAVAAAGSGLEGSELDAALYLDRAIQSQLVRGRRAGLIVAPDEEEPSVWSAIARLDASLTEVRDTTVQISGAGAATRRAVESLRPEMDRLAARVARDSALADAAHLRLEQEDARTDARAAGAQSSAEAAQARAADAARSAAQSAREMEALGRRVDTVAGALEQLEGGLQGLARRIPNTGLLLVVSASDQPLPYEVRGPEGAARGVGVGLHALPPGSYTVVGRGVSAERQVVAGEAVTVLLQAFVTGVTGATTAPVQ